MSDIKREKILVEHLDIGMFVVELDRAWEGTPFLLQGFLLEVYDEIETLRSLCAHVYIDRSRSTRHHFATTTHDVGIKHNSVTVRIKAPNAPPPTTTQDSKSAKKVSFFDVLRELRAQQLNTPEVANSNPVFNMRYTSDSVAPVTKDKAVENQESIFAPKTVAKEILNSVGSALGGLGGLLPRTRFSDTIEETKAKKVSSEKEAVKVFIYEDTLPVEDEIVRIKPVFDQTEIATREIFESVANANEIDLTGVSEMLDSMVESIGRLPEALMWLAKLKNLNTDDYSHALNVSITMMAFGNFLAFSKTQIKTLGLAGLLQDIGKVKISPEVLRKPGKLTKEEFQHAKLHVEEGLQIVKSTIAVPETVIDIIAKHHERVDGSGYPEGLGERDLSLIAQVAGLIDTYCAIIANKVYAKGAYHQHALERIHNLAGKSFTTELVDQLVQFLGMYPVSSLVELNTGEVAVVVQQNQVRRLLPRLMVLLAPDKSRYGAPIMLNLLQEPQTPSGEPYKIVKGIKPNSYGLDPNSFYL